MLAGEADEATRQRIENRRRLDPAFFDATEPMRLAWAALPVAEQSAMPVAQVQESWMRFRSLANMPPLEPPVAAPAVERPLPVRDAWLNARRERLLRIAASWVALIAIPIAGIWLWSPSDPSPTAVSRTALAGVTTTGANERRTLALADGSMVLLEPNSRLTIPSGTSRELSLAGAATFTVRRADGATFRVRSDVAVVTVTGTVFRVDASVPGETSVAVSEGKVLLAGLAPDAPMVTLGAGERGRLREGEAPSVEAKAAREPR